MALTSAIKSEIMSEHRVSEADTGSVEVQVALLTKRIRELTEHFKVHKKDLHSKRGLLFLVNRRKKLLKYAKRKDSERYLKIIKRLGLRDTY